MRVCVRGRASARFAAAFGDGTVSTLNSIRLSLALVGVVVGAIVKLKLYFAFVYFYAPENTNFNLNISPQSVCYIVLALITYSVGLAACCVLVGCVRRYVSVSWRAVNHGNSRRFRRGVEHASEQTTEIPESNEIRVVFHSTPSRLEDEGSAETGPGDAIDIYLFNQAFTSNVSVSPRTN